MLFFHPILECEKGVCGIADRVITGKYAGGVAASVVVVVVAIVEKVVGVNNTARAVIFTFNDCPSDPYYATYPSRTPLNLSSSTFPRG